MRSEFVISVPESAGRIRLDVFICEFLEKEAPGSFSRSVVQNAITGGGCFVDEKCSKKAGQYLSGGELVKILIQSPVSDVLPDPDVQFDVLYEDDAVIVISKPPGLVVHPAPGVKGSTLVHGIVDRIRRDERDESPERPGIVHRLDKDTSGVMVVAKTAQSKRHLQGQLREPRTMKRVYHAICHGVPKNRRGVSTVFDDIRNQLKGTITASIIRHPHNRIRYQVSESPDARHAVSHFRILEVREPASLIEFTLETGRTHQIRVHAEYAGCPIIGDTVYGPKKSSIPGGVSLFNRSRQMLHARSLAFVHPVSGELVTFTSPYPDDFTF
jgi:23S rRNA pseudouridine1911/1915/1917 synthase